MKAVLLILALSLQSFGAFGQSFFQIDASHSFASSRREIQNVSGIITLQDKFADSRIELNSSTLTFKTSEIVGTEDAFELKGELEQNGIRQEVVLKGNLIQGNSGRILVKISSEQFALHILASRPQTGNTALYKEVQEIIQ